MNLRLVTAVAAVAAACGDEGGEPIEPALAETRPATALGLDALSVNGRIQPGGAPTRWWFELGETTAYGRRTEATSLPPPLTAHYLESWNDGLAGWAGGLSGTLLEHVAEGGVDGGFVRYQVPGELDAAHADGIGANALVQYLYGGAFRAVPIFAALGGGDPDLRGARIAAAVRGTDWVGPTGELVFWLQSTPDLAAAYDDATARWSNWAYSAAGLTEGLASGDWEALAYQLTNDTSDWTYAGHYVAAERATYVYVPLDQVLGHQNGDLFHMLTFFDYGAPPAGTIDLDEVEITYRNESVLTDACGGTLASSPADGDDAARLTDGWRHGPERGWSAPAPAGGEPLVLAWTLASPVELHTVQLHQDPAWPSRAVEVRAATTDGAWQTIAAGELPASHPAGANFNYLLVELDEPVLASRVEVHLTSGWTDERWGLGEVELFGDGAVSATDDDAYAVTADFDGLTAGVTYHYRVAAENEGGISHGDDATFTVPLDATPLVATGAVTRIAGATAKVEGRVSPLGLATNYWFDFGPDTTYGRATQERYAGLELTPRTVTDTMVDLVPGETVHVRLVAVNAAGTAYGDDVTFVAQ